MAGAFSSFGFSDAFDIELDLPTVSPLRWIVDQPSSQSFAADGGIPPYTYRLAFSLLPRCITCSIDGILSGTVYKVGSWAFVIEVTDSLGATEAWAYTLEGVLP